MSSSDGSRSNASFAHANNRVLIVDDSPSLHEDYKKILARRSPPDLAAAELAVFNETDEIFPGFELTHALQGEEAVTQVRAAHEAGRPFALAFVDVRMPPGIDGVETVGRLWKIDPELQIVICSAH